MRLIITGTPGTGKSTIAKLLAKKAGLELFSITEIVKIKMRIGAKHEVDIKKLAKHLLFLKKLDDYVVEGHLACELPLPADNIVVLRTDPSILKRRMAKRGYGKEKIEENMMSEMLDYCSIRVKKEYKKNPLELDTSKRKPPACVNKILAALMHKKKRIDSVDYSKRLISFLRLRHGR
jgi:adenylate kinase